MEAPEDPEGGVEMISVACVVEVTHQVVHCGAAASFNWAAAECNDKHRATELVH